MKTKGYTIPTTERSGKGKPIKTKKISEGREEERDKQVEDRGFLGQ